MPKVNIDEIGGDEFAIDHDTRRNINRLAPFVHGLVVVIANVRCWNEPQQPNRMRRWPACSSTRQGLIEKVEQVRHATAGNVSSDTQIIAQQTRPM